MTDAKAIAAAMGGEARGDTAHIPTPGHTAKDRGTVVKVDPDAPDGALVHSFNGGDALAIKDELRERGLLPERDTSNSFWRDSKGNDLRPKKPVSKQAKATFKTVARFEYANADGEVIYCTLRQEPEKWDGPGKRPKQFRAERFEGGQWIKGLGDCERIPYRMADIAEAREWREPVYFVEGEGKADRLAEMGVKATAIPFGANGWRTDYASHFARSNVVILPDNDAPGRDFARRIYADLKDIAKVCIVELPGLPEAGDVIDWTGTIDDLVKLTNEATLPDWLDQQEAEPQTTAPDPVDILGKFESPELPRSLLPPLIGEWAKANSDDSGCDIAGLAMAALAVCAAAIPDSIKLKGKRNGQWSESARIWVALLGDPSTRKSPMINRAQSPICNLDVEMLAQANRDLIAWQDSGRDGPKPLSPRLRLNDATSEAAQEVAKESPDGLLLVQDELSGFFSRIEKYGGKGGGADRSFWLQAYNGGQYAVNRISRGSFVIDNLSFSMLGGIQLEPIKQVVAGAADDGLIQRILPIILRNPGEELDEPEPPVNGQYEELIKRLHSLKPPSSFLGTKPLEFDDEALEVCRAFVKRYQSSEAVETVNKKLAAHLGKYSGLFVRLCLIWHCIENTNQTELPKLVSKAVAYRVADFIDSFLVKHAYAFYTEVVGVSDDGGVLEAAAGHILAHKLTELTVRDLQRSTGGRRSLEALEAQRVLERLESVGWGVLRSPERANGRPLLKVNPQVHRKFEQQARKEVERREAAKKAIAELAA